jgi:hypothetical protein
MTLLFHKSLRALTLRRIRGVDRDLTAYERSQISWEIAAAVCWANTARERGIATALVYPTATPPGPPLTRGGEDSAVFRVGEATGTGVLRVGAIGAPADEPPTGGRGGGLHRGEENALLEMEQEVFREIERLGAEGLPVDDLLKEVLSASAELHAYLEQSHPRAP